MSKKKAPEPEIYTSAEVADYVGITMRQVDYWTKQGWLPCNAAKYTPRRFTESAREKARAMHFFDRIGFVESEASRVADDLLSSLPKHLLLWDDHGYTVEISHQPKS